MTIFIIEERGRILKDHSLRELVKAFFKKENIPKATVMACNDQSCIDGIIKNKKLSEWELIFLGIDKPPYKLGDRQKEVFQQLDFKRNLSSLVKELLMHDGVI